MVPSVRSTRASIAVLLLLTGLSAGACGSSGAAPPAGQGPRAPAATATSAGQGGQGGQATGPGKPAGGNQASGSSGVVLAVLPAGTKIVYRGTLSRQVADVDAAVRAGREVVADVGGYLAGSRQSRD